MDYNFREIEKKWQDWWKANDTYKVSNNSDKPKYYVLDMFPYPSGAGLHVGHPLGYIASDIYARYKRLKGFNVLHPMGYDAFGLPAEQYAIEHGIHPTISTRQNIENFRKQLDKIGFCFDWSREVNTSEPSYYKWTQWIFLQLFKSFYNRTTKKAESIESLVEIFEREGNKNHPVPNSQFQIQSTVNGKQSTDNKFTADEWNGFDEKQQQNILMEYRLSYCGYGEVNWCEALGTVLANDEVINGVSERGGYPVIKKKLRQWYLRITEYADRLLEGLQTVDFSEAMKEMQINWIGKSYGAEIDFKIADSNETLRVFTTRPDTIFGVDFMVIAPEHELVEIITTAKHKEEVEQYINWVKSRSDRERQAEKTISGVFTGAYAVNPFDKREIPIYISEYVLAGYGTGAIMAVPCGDERDFKFAKHFNIPITNILGEKFNGEEANPTKDAVLENSDFLNGIVLRNAIHIVNEKLVSLGIGKTKVNYKMRDAAFSRQRYWGEPFPIIWKDGVAYPLDENELPLELPYIEDIKPGKDGEGPLANNLPWVNIQPDSQIDLTLNPSPKKREKKKDTPGYITNTVDQWKILSAYAKENRRNKTEAEHALWQVLRNRKLDGFKFRRQHSVAGYIPDFVCIERKLIIEIDGAYHNDDEQKKFDDARTEWLIEHQYKLVRFTNEEVINNIEDVTKKISAVLTIDKNNVGTGSPSPLERELEGEVAARETNTMPGYAGSSWYFLRYMDPNNNETFCSKQASDYWNQVDVYVGGTEHAVGHLLYSRMWTKFLYDLKLISYDEPYKKLLNQGMITAFGYYIDVVFYNNQNQERYPMYGNLSEIKKNKLFRDKRYNGIFINHGYAEGGMRLPYIGQYLDNSNRITRKKYAEYFDQNKKTQNVPFDFDFIYSQADDNPDNDYITVNYVHEKMSKSKFNTVDPSDLVEKYGADTFRMYEMFLGPVEQSKPWDTKGIEGVHRFLRKLWRLFYKDVATAPSPLERAGGEVIITNGKPTDAELKILHKAIKKIEEDTERFSYNTAVSAFMVCVNELSDLKCTKKEILEPLVIMLSSYAPHIAEELYHALGNNTSVLDATYPLFDQKYLVESTKEYPISINGKLRTTLKMALDAQQQEIEDQVLENEVVKKWLDGKPPKKIIFVQGKMVNVVI